MADYRRAAENARAAGFDGVELHGANGYLPDQFLRDGSNQRTDGYGGSIANRARFMLEAAAELISVWGADRVGVRLSPSGNYQGMRDSDPRATFGHVVRELAGMRVGYLHIMEKLGSAPPLENPEHDLAVSYFRPMYGGVIIANSGFTLEKAQTYIKEGWADAVAFGRLFISNPDLPERFRRIAAGDPVPLAEPDATTFYTPGEKGYTDYPALV
jgi:N-ethylmaleimide reductase